jgi:hypothetical protein
MEGAGVARMTEATSGSSRISLRSCGLLLAKDGVATAAAIVIFWPAAFFVGGDKQTAAELSQMKGQMVAVEQAAIAKKCGIQFQGPRPPGT